MSDRNRRAAAMTIPTPLWPGLRLAQLGVLGFVRTFPWVLNPLRKAGMIHFASWTVVRRSAFRGAPGRPENVHHDYVLFDVAFQGDWEEYIDAFGQVFPWRLIGFWGTSFGFPGPRPTDRLRKFVDYSRLPVDHFWSAYPDHTPRTVEASLRLVERFDAFQSEVADLGPTDFAAAYQRFVRASQGDL